MVVAVEELAIEERRYFEKCLDNFDPHGTYIAMVYILLLGVLASAVLVVVANVPKHLTNLVLLMTVALTAITSSFFIPIPSYTRTLAIASLALAIVLSFIASKQAEARNAKTKPIVVHYTFRSLVK